MRVNYCMYIPYDMKGLETAEKDMDLKDSAPWHHDLDGSNDINICPPPHLLRTLSLKTPTRRSHNGPTRAEMRSYNARSHGRIQGEMG